MDVRYALDAVRRNWSSRHWWATIFNSLVAGRYYETVGTNDGVHVLEESWDNLLILDGCRYDLFEEVHESGGVSLPGTLEERTSRGTGSPDFLGQNFGDGPFHDVVYVTANPFVRKELDDPFVYVEDVWLDRWDDELETVPAEAVADAAREVHERYPNKRLIVHFMQPHHPFVGETRLENDRGYVGARAKSLGTDVPDAKFVWERLREGELDHETVWEAYRDNLRYVLGVADELVGDLPGKSVLTSDHGNAFGERARPFPTRVYGHGGSIRIPALTEVPWYVVDSSDRREIVPADDTETRSDDGDDVIEERLEALGYVDQ